MVCTTQSSIVSGHLLKTTLFSNNKAGMSKAASPCYWQYWAHTKHCHFQNQQGQSSTLAAHVTQFSKSPDIWCDSFMLKNSTVSGKKEAERTVSKAKASEMVLNSFSEAAKVIQVKSLRIKEAKTLGKNINSITVKYHFLLQTQPVPLFLQRSLSLFSIDTPCTKIQLSVSLRWRRNGLWLPLCDTRHDSCASLTT